MPSHQPSSHHYRFYLEHEEHVYGQSEARSPHERTNPVLCVHVNAQTVECAGSVVMSPMRIPKSWILSIHRCGPPPDAKIIPQLIPALLSSKVKITSRFI